MRKISKVIIHCAYTSADMDVGAKTIREWHKGRGWNDVGYHYVIRRNGRIEAGRTEETVGAHAYGQNENSIGVCLVGGKPDCNYTRAQWHSLMHLVSDLTRRYSDAEVIGHRDVSDKSCPQFDARAWWYG